MLAVCDVVGSFADKCGRREKAITFQYANFVPISPKIRSVLDFAAAPGPTEFGSIIATPRFQVSFSLRVLHCPVGWQECIDHSGEIQTPRESSLRHDWPADYCREGAGSRDTRWVQHLSGCRLKWPWLLQWLLVCLKSLGLGTPVSMGLNEWMNEWKNLHLLQCSDRPNTYPPIHNEVKQD